MYRRNSETELHAALADTPVVLLNGARQTGKSTLAARLANTDGSSMVTLDEATALAAATADPQGFVAGIDALAEQADGRLCAGVVLYGGDQVVSFRSNKLALPMERLWSGDASGYARAGP
jgi:hypothetical protein